MEHYGQRFRIVLGDLSMEACGERDSGGEFSVTIGIGLDCAEFTGYGPNWPQDHHDKTDHVSHSLMICLWRWGLYVSVAGRRVRQ